jgi:hypothetical protein
VTPTQFLDAVRLRTAKLLTLAAITDKPVDFDSAERTAARQVAAEQRAKRPTAALATSTWDGSAETAGDELLRRILAIGSRLRESARLGLDKLADRKSSATAPREAITSYRVQPRISRRSSLLETNKPPQPDSETVGVFVGNTSSAQLIPDSEFHTSFHDQTTQNYRRSIAENERIERERRAAWLVRLQERRERQL